MNPILQYPFDSETLLKKRRFLRKSLLEDGGSRQEVKIALLGGSTTHDIKDMLELFLLNQDIRPSFYESEFGQYWQDAMFPPKELMEFKPNLLFIHTSNRDIMEYPKLSQSAEEIDELLQRQFAHFSAMWDKLYATYHCPMIQNNFDYPAQRLLGNRDAVDIHGRVRFINRLNERFCEYAREHDFFHLHDLNYLSASYGLDQWADPFYWHMYKYALSMQAIPTFAFSVSNIIKSLLGKNKKGLVLDLDNTLWGGVVGDDGVDGVEIGHETSVGQVFTAFQAYLKSLKDYGILLNVDSKNDEQNALDGLNHPEGTLRPEDFICIKANWEPKDENLRAIAEELNLLPESLVFIDDNPAERAIVRGRLPGVAVPEWTEIQDVIRIIDHSGFFETTHFSADDAKRNEMYQENAERAKRQAAFSDYQEYLLSLDMKATIRAFEPLYMQRIAQLTNKSNQFNLTTKRFTEPEIEAIAADPSHVTLYGKLEDRFGDNGVISVTIGEIKGNALHIGLWLMSCRVLKRDMEFAMMDALAAIGIAKGLEELVGYYLPTAKNGMVRDFYARQGFTKLSEDERGNCVWRLPLAGYRPKNHVIAVNGGSIDKKE